VVQPRKGFEVVFVFGVICWLCAGKDRMSISELRGVSEQQEAESQHISGE